LRLNRSAYNPDMTSEPGIAGGHGRPNPVRQLRVIVQATDFAAAVAFYRDLLGLEEQTAFIPADQLT
jgi:hypothetical protein